MVLIMITETSVLIIGGGIAGLVSALELGDRGIDVVVISSGEGPASANSYRAQGGIGYRSPDEPEGLFKNDIMNAGAGLCNEKAVDQLVQLGPKAIEEILKGIPFEKETSGEWKLTQEGAHSIPRILFHGDQTGKVIMEGLYQKVTNHPHVTLLHHQSAIDLITLSHHSKMAADIYQSPTCVGAYILSHQTEEVYALFAEETILATGGVGECFLHTTNGKESRGDGIAMAYRAGVRIMNMEYVQFHPTALYTVGEPRFLLSETLRGEGGQILSHEGDILVDPLSPRDVAARAIFEEMVRTNHPHVWLDIHFKGKEALQNRFPAIYQHCKDRGWEMDKHPLPIVPAAHYSCGGVAVDLEGQTTMRGLRAIGEVACSGLHGANRLASTALLEGLVWARTCSRSIRIKKVNFPEIEPWKMGVEKIDNALLQQDWMTIKQTMWNYVGLLRSSRRLKRADKMLRELKWEINSFYEEALLTPELLALRNGCETALLITQGALQSPRSRGCHYIVDEKVAFM